MKLTVDQSEAVVSAFNHIVLHKINPPPTRTLTDMCYLISGKAGTGKSVVISKIWDLLKKEEMIGSVVTLTSRAAENLALKGVPCTTYHSKMYEPVVDEKGNLKYFKMLSPQQLKEAIGDFCIFEEVSFINSDVIKTIAEMGIPIIMVGDDAQLPAIDGLNIFDRMVDDKNPLDIPVTFLDEIKRTAEDSSIPFFSNHIRETGDFDWSLMGNNVSRVNKRSFNLKWLKANWHEWDLIICGTNRTRKKFNRLVRAAMGHFSDLPEIGETVLCLQNNVLNGVRISNGDLFEVVAAYPADRVSSFQVKKILPGGRFGPTITITVDNNFWEEEVAITKGQRDEIQEFTYGYALTCHKVQGSEMPNVIFIDENVSFFLPQGKFRYTACTRASEKLLVVT